MLYKGISIFVHRSALPLVDADGAAAQMKDFVKVGDILKVEVLRIDVEEKKILEIFVGKNEPSSVKSVI